MISGADPEIEFSTILKIFSKRSRIQPLLLKVHINCLEEPKYLFKPGQPSRGVERTFFYYGPGTITCIWNDIILINEAPYRYRYQIVYRTDNKWSEGKIWIILISICVCKSVPRPIVRNRKWSRDYDVIGHFCKKTYNLPKWSKWSGTRCKSPFVDIWSQFWESSDPFYLQLKKLT